MGVAQLDAVVRDVPSDDSPLALGAGVSLNAPESPPVANESPAIWDLVRADVAKRGPSSATAVRLDADMAERDKAGRAKYGTPLQHDNGRDMLVDGYQEALDLCVYLKGANSPRYYTALALAFDLRSDLFERDGR